MNTRIRFEYDQDADTSYLEPGDEPVVSYGAILERQCDMGEWHVVDSLWGCDILASEDCDYTGTYGPANVPEVLRFASEQLSDESGSMAIGLALGTTALLLFVLAILPALVMLASVTR